MFVGAGYWWVRAIYYKLIFMYVHAHMLFHVQLTNAAVPQKDECSWCKTMGSDSPTGLQLLILYIHLEKT
jgi:hypothetical protein